MQLRIAQFHTFLITSTSSIGKIKSIEQDCIITKNIIINKYFC